MRTSATRASPHRPPRPAASGQAAGGARADRAADRASTPPVAESAFTGVGLSRCCTASPIARERPKAPSNRAAGQGAGPRDCLDRSADGAALRPRRLGGGALAAALRLGSAGFHDTSATSSRPASKACATPRTRTTKGAPHRMRAPIQARWPRARAADMQDGTPGGRDSTVVVAPTGLRGHLPRGVGAEPGCPYAPHHPPLMPHWTPTPAGATTRPMSSSEPYDLVIAGAGMVGATFALAAAQGGLKVVVVDPQPFDSQLAPSFDGRSTAIAFSTFRMLDALGVGAALRPHACRMDRILVTDGRRPGAASRSASSAFLRFDAEIGRAHV